MRYNLESTLPIRAFSPRATGPFGRGMTLEGGGGGGGIVSAITDPISSAIGTDGSGGGVLGELAKIDPGPAIGGALAGLDKSVNQSIPGGWMTLGALAATVATMGAASGWLGADLAVDSTVAMEDGSVLTTFSDGSTALTDASGATTYTSSGGATLGATDTSTAALPTADPTVGITPTEMPPAPPPEPVAPTPVEAPPPVEAPVAPGSTGLNPGSTVGTGLNAGSPSGIAATESSAGLGGSGTGIIEGLSPSSVGMGGTAGAGSLSGIAGNEAAAGLGGTNLTAGLTADQLAQYESNVNSGMTPKDALDAARAANTAKNLLGGNTGSTLANLAGAGAVGAGLAGMANNNIGSGQAQLNYTPTGPNFTQLQNGGVNPGYMINAVAPYQGQQYDWGAKSMSPEQLQALMNGTK